MTNYLSTRLILAMKTLGWKTKWGWPCRWSRYVGSLQYASQARKHLISPYPLNTVQLYKVVVLFTALPVWRTRRQNRRTLGKLLKPSIQHTHPSTHSWTVCLQCCRHLPISQPRQIQSLGPGSPPKNTVQRWREVALELDTLGYSLSATLQVWQPLGAFVSSPVKWG